jgi:hypothetical protein
VLCRLRSVCSSQEDARARTLGTDLGDRLLGREPAVSCRGNKKGHLLAFSESLPWVATGCRSACLSRFRSGAICDWLPLVPPAWLHKCPIPAVVSGRSRPCSPLRELACSRGEVVEPGDLFGAQLDTVGSGVLFDAGDALGAGIGAMSSPCARSQANAICAGVASSSEATAFTSSTMTRTRPGRDRADSAAVGERTAADSAYRPADCCVRRRYADRPPIGR